MLPSRRVALRSAAALPFSLLLAPRANAKCSCPTGIDSCVCTDEAPTTKNNVERLKEFRPRTEDAQWRRVEATEQLQLQAGSSQQLTGRTDRDEAKQRFADVVAKTAKKREADLGFALDAEDIKELEGILRIKYCGPEGLIGPC